MESGTERPWHGSGLVLLVAAMLSLAGVIFGATTGTPALNATVDLSWPNCSLVTDKFFSGAVIGVTGGLDFHSNPCAGDETVASSSYELYANTGDPGFPRIKQFSHGPLVCQHHSLICYSFNYGYAAGVYARRQADLAGLHAALWWLDVESINSWTNSVVANRADVQGMMIGINGLSNNFLLSEVGIYSAANQWRAVVGDWKPAAPLWLGTGDTSLKTAAAACMRPSFIRGPEVLTQYTIANLDYDYVCRPLNVGYFQFSLNPLD